jgi:hypothetical protein
MLVTKVKPDWQGETKEALLDKGDMILAEVRAFPRAYLFPPRLTSVSKHTLDEDIDQRANEALPMPNSGGVQLLPWPTFQRPPINPEHRKVM